MNSSKEKKVVLRKRVYLYLMWIPKGRVITYGELAKAVGCSSPRAVGQILGNNFRHLDPCEDLVAPNPNF